MTNSAYFTTICPACAQQLEIDKELFGSSVTCPSCKEIFTANNSTGVKIIQPEKTALSFWNKKLGVILRWILFLPVGFISSGFLQATPVLVFYWASSIEWKFTLLNLILGLIAASFITGGVSLWFFGVVMAPYLACKIVAPKKNIAIVIFATLYIFLQAVTLFGYVTSGYPLLLIIYHTLFAVLLIASCVHHFKDSE